MLHLHFAPSLDLLAADMAPLLHDAWSDPFASPEVIVPNPVVGKWLQMRLADGNLPAPQVPTPDGCIANLPMPTLEHFLWKVLQPDAPWELLDLARLQQIVCALLDEQRIGSAGFESVKMYLSGDTGRIDALKRIQLSARIANRLLEYEYNRPGVWRGDERRWRPEGVGGAWISGRHYLTENDHDEWWQAEIYRLVRSCLSGAGQNAQAPMMYTLPQLYRIRRNPETSATATWTAKPGVGFIFGVTKVSHFHRNLLVEISQMAGIDMHVYLTNPCAEFWEDVDTRRGMVRRFWHRSSENPGIAARLPDDYNKEELAFCTNALPVADQKLLELWGNAGKENIFLWCQDAQWNFDYRTRPGTDNGRQPRTILEALQISLLQRQNRMMPPETGHAPDGSLQILACPDLGREMEEVREQILDAIHNGVAAQLNEIVVYLPDPAVYVPFIQRVFGRFGPASPQYLPFCILGASGKASVAARGIALLIDIAESRFDRAHLFELLHNPIVQATRGITAPSVAIWEQWAESEAMFRGYDRDSRSEMGDTGSTITDAHTFGLGMARMLVADLAIDPVPLGFSEQDESGCTREIPVVPYRDFETTDRALLEQFCATIDALHHGGAKLRNAVRQGIDTALDTLTELVTLWFDALPDNDDLDIATEGGIIGSFLDSIRTIALQQHIANRTGMPSDEFFAAVRGCLPEELPVRSAAWTGGITFVPLRPSMVVPHRVVIVAGLDAGSFPGSNERPSWDLLSRKRIIGDSDRVRDNRFAFLELIHAAQERLVITYRARDMRKEEELQPSSVVLELATFLRDQGFATPGSDGKEICSLLREIPWIVHESLGTAAAATPQRPHGSWEASEHVLARLSREPRTAHRHDLAATVTRQPEGTQHFKITRFDVQTYFSNPLEFHLRKTLGLDNAEEVADMSASDEPLDSGARATAIIQQDIWKSVLRLVFPPLAERRIADEPTLRRHAQEQARRSYMLHAATGGAPEALLGRMELDFIIEWAGACVAPTLELLRLFPHHYLIEHTDAALNREGVPATIAIDLENGARCSIECGHPVVLVPQSGAPCNTIAVIAVKKEGRATENPALWLEGVLQWQSEANRPHSPAISIVQFNRGAGDSMACDIDCVDFRPYGDIALVKAMHRWLAALIAEMLVDRRCDHLPFACIQQHRERLSMHAIEEDLASEHPSYRPYFAAFALADARLPALSDEALGTVVKNRYAPMLDEWLSTEGAPP